MVEESIQKHFSANSRLIDYLDERLQLSKEMNQMDAAEMKFTPEINARDRSLRTKKVRILNDIVFQAMADLTFFFKAIALHPELQEILDSDIKDLLGVRYTTPQDYGFMILDLLRSILIVEDGQKEGIKRDDFRLRLIYKIQGIVMDKARRFLPLVFKNVSAEHIVWEDLGRAWAWTAMLAIDKEFGDPHRTFDFDTANLLNK